MPTSSPLIPRATFFGNPDKASVHLSPNGQYIAYLAPLDGVLNLYVAPVGENGIATATPITRDQGRGIQGYTWAYDNTHLLYIQDKDGDENWHIYKVAINTDDTGKLTYSEPTNLTPFENVQAKFIHMSHKHADKIVVGVNNRTPAWHDFYIVDLNNNEHTLLYENTPCQDSSGAEIAGLLRLIVDDNFDLRFAAIQTPSGGSKIFAYDKNNAVWHNVLEFGLEDSITTYLLNVNSAGDTLYLLDSRNKDTNALISIPVNSNSDEASLFDIDNATVLYQHPQADINHTLSHPVTGEMQAVTATYTRSKWYVLDESLESDMDYLQTVSNGDYNIISQNDANTHWILTYNTDNAPTSYYLYNREAKQATFLFHSKANLKDISLATMESIVIEASDGLPLVSYLTLPYNTPHEDGIPNEPLPLVLWVHGGPWARDHWGYNPIHQWLSNRGYAILSVNFRGSTGFGKNFVNAGNLEWGAKMHQDLLDAVDWAVEKGIANPDKVAIFGGSYGGYAALAGLTFSPEVFAAAIDIVGPSNLVTLVESIPPYWEPMIETFTKRMGDPRTEEGRQLLTERSPLTHAERIVRPLLIAQGANDPRVKQAESDQIVAAMQEKNIPVTYVLYPDEGHGFARPENRLSFFAIAEVFLAQHLGGTHEPIGKAFTGSSLQVKTKAEDVAGLAEALADNQ